MSATPPKDPIAALRYLSPILEAQGNSQIAGALISCADQLEREVAELRNLLVGRIAWLKKEIEAGGDYEHLNTRRREAIYIAEKLGVEWFQP